jgi:hypothetical protein
VVGSVGTPLTVKVHDIVTCCPLAKILAIALVFSYVSAMCGSPSDVSTVHGSFSNISTMCGSFSYVSTVRGSLSYASAMRGLIPQSNLSPKICTWLGLRIKWISLSWISLSWIIRAKQFVSLT